MYNHPIPSAFCVIPLCFTDHMVSWYQYVHNQYGGHHQVHYKYWMEYGDLDIMNGDIPLADVYDPSKDYANPDKNEKNPLTGKSANEAA